ncbi:MAG: hypothetical protein EPN33_10110 [Acidobacteria bacterium]|nr:MAG: hypothetical protein EPN33_10110 [Acidobacteriota bacterium]
MTTAQEIVQLLAAHSGEPVDYVAIVTLLNTVAGGHYEERHSEAAIGAALLGLLESGQILAVAPEAAAPAPPEQAACGRAVCVFRLG